MSRHSPAYGVSGRRSQQEGGGFSGDCVPPAGRPPGQRRHPEGPCRPPLGAQAGVRRAEGLTPTGHLAGGPCPALPCPAPPRRKKTVPCDFSSSCSPECTRTLEERLEVSPPVTHGHLRRASGAGSCSHAEGEAQFSPAGGAAVRLSSHCWAGGQGGRGGGQRGCLQKLQTLKGSEPQLNKVNLLTHHLFLLGSALARVPRTRGSLAGAALQIHEAGKTRPLAPRVTITGRAKRRAYLASRGSRAHC